eukprot:9064894-Alexandrium_andersonii.AAC.1
MRSSQSGVQTPGPARVRRPGPQANAVPGRALRGARGPCEGCPRRRPARSAAPPRAAAREGARRELRRNSLQAVPGGPARAAPRGDPDQRPPPPDRGDRRRGGELERARA